MIKRIVFAATLLAMLVATPLAGASAQWDSCVVRTVAPGVLHRRVVVNSGPWRVNILEVNLRHPGIGIRGVRANDSFLTRETVSSMAERYKGPGRVVAAINGDFFNVRTGESENNVVIEGKFSKGLMVTDSPHDSFDNLHSQLGVDWDNRAWIERFGLDARILFPGGAPMRLDAINFRPDSGAVVLYTSALGDSSPPDTSGLRPTLLPLRMISHRGDTTDFEVFGSPLEGGRVSLGGGGVLSAGGAAREEMRRMRSGQRLTVVSTLGPSRTRMRTVIGGWPRVVEHGRSVAEQADSVEGTFPRFSRQRHPRAAAGMSRDSTTLFLITVDGRRDTEAGMTLPELAKVMLDLGVYEGMNFDGGGSTTMVVEGKVVNRPSDQAGARAVGSGLLVIIGDTR